MNTKKHLSAAIGVAMALVMLPAGNAISGWNESGGEQEEALTLTPDLENGLEVYEVCAACHLPEGWGKPDGTFPMLAGQHTWRNRAEWQLSLSCE